MSFATFPRDGATLRYRDVGTGLPVVFQHGLGGDEAQVADVFPATPATRRLTLECRGQGGSEFGPPDRLSIETFADDIEALTASLGIPSFVAGGISMGAAIALRLAVRHPRRVRALVLARPAWVTEPAPANMRPYALAGDLLQRLPPAEARAAFEASEIAATLAEAAPDNLASLLGFFDRAEPRSFGQLLWAIAADGPGVLPAELQALDLPVLVIGNDRDFAHPLAMAEELASLIPGARLARITSKAVDRVAYRSEFETALAGFLGGLA